MNIFIFRRDFRIQDNTTLTYLSQSIDQIAFIFIFNPQQTDAEKNKYFSQHCFNYMIYSLDKLRQNIHLQFFQGDTIDVLKSIIKHNKIRSISFNEDVTPFSKQRDNKIQQLCDQNNIQCNHMPDVFLFPISLILNKNNDHVPKKFNNFYENMRKIKTKPSLIQEEKLNRIRDNSYDQDIKSETRVELQIFLKNIQKPQLIQFSKIEQRSQLFKFGLISHRIFYNENKIMRRNMLWREIYYHNYNENPSYFQPIRIKYYRYLDEKHHIKDYLSASTGFPIIDASIIQLKETGVITNKQRLLLANFFVKLVIADWRIAEQKLFSRYLLDYDPVINNANWQWVSSTGFITQPYFRTCNPWRQQMLIDPDCEIIKKYLPKLKPFDKKIIHKWYDNYDEQIHFKPIFDYEKRTQKYLSLMEK